MGQGERVKAFLKELAELTKKYGLSIGGCGCCGSPWIWDLQNNSMPYDSLNFDEEKEIYTYIEW